MRSRQARDPILIGLMLTGLGTSAGVALPAEAAAFPRAVEQTTAGAPVVPSVRVGAAIAELRRVTGFTWDQLARLFGVSRRALHFWASGKAMTPGNQEHLHRLLAVMKKVDRGSATANRAALLSVREGGALPFDLLAAAEYDRVVSLLSSEQRRRARAPKVSAEVLAARAPRPPDELVGALHDRVHPDSGRLLPMKAVPIPRRK
jgi:DNA-binding transcriptional regulator YiaG